jgi:capsular exopolysaccharide synthesis family protein
MDTNEYSPEAPQDRAGRSSRFHTRLYRWQSLARRLWWVPVCTTLLALGIGGFLIWRTPASFVSRGQMIVSIKLSIPEGSVYTEELSNFLGTQVALMQSQAVQNRAFLTLQSSYPVPPAPPKVSVTVLPKTTIFAFAAAGPDPQYTQAFLQACMEAYITLKKEMRTQTSQTTLAGITEELARLESELRKGEEELVAFQKSKSVVDLQEQGNSTASYLAILNRQLAELQTQYQLLSMLTLEQNLERQQKAAKPEANADNSASPFQGDSTDYLRAKQQIQLLKAQQQELGEYLRPKHPKMVKLTDDISQREKLLEIFRQQSQDQLGNNRDSLGLQITNLVQRIKEWEGKSLEASEKIAEYQKIKSSNQRVQNLYDRLLATMQTLDINKEISPESVNIMTPASPAYRDRGQLPKTLILSLVLGLAAGLGLLFLVDRFDDRLNSFTELQNEFDEEILGQIPRDPNANKGINAQLIQAHDDRHAFVEAYRNLRSSLLFINPDKRPKLLLVTSSIPGDGKTLTTANLSIAMAHANSRVLLIDADLRKGVLHQRFGVEATEGLHEAILQNRPWQSLVKSTSTPNLFLLPRGATTPHSSELFLNPAVPALLREATEHYDFVIVDSAPVMAADDATSLAPFVDGVLFVLRAQQTSARVARAALDLLYQRRVNVLGIVLNAVSTNASEYYYYKYKDYYAAYPEEKK